MFDIVNIITTLLSWLLSWFGIGSGIIACAVVAWLFPKYRVHALIVAAAICLSAGVYHKVRHDAQEEVLVKIEKEKTDAIGKAQEARARVRALCARNPRGCVRNDWYRD